MKILGQPDSYSDMLERIFYCTVITSIVCVFVLSQNSPEFKSFLGTLNYDVDVWGVKGIKALYVLIPLAIALFSRFIKLHDKISDVLLIRNRFDKNHILKPLATKVGYDLPLSLNNKKRNDLMYKVFYAYAGFNDPAIDAQLVRTALDNWGWFWVTVESNFIILLTATIFAFMGLLMQLWIFPTISLIVLAFSIFTYNACVRTATAEVNAICDDENRRNEILEKFSKEEG